MVADQVESFINELQERTSNGRLVWNPVSGEENWEKKKHRIEKSIIQYFRITTNLF